MPPPFASRLSFHLRVSSASVACSPTSLSASSSEGSSSASSRWRSSQRSRAMPPRPARAPPRAQHSEQGRPAVRDAFIATPSSNSASMSNCSARMTRRLNADHVSPARERSTSKTCIDGSTPCFSRCAFCPATSFGADLSSLCSPPRVLAQSSPVYPLLALYLSRTVEPP